MLSNVAPHTLGVALAGGEMDPLISRGTPLPYAHTDRYTTQTNNQPVVTIKILEGDEPTASANRVLGKFALKVPPAPAGEPQILVTFRLDADGILSVSAKDEATGHKMEIRVDGRANMDARARKEASRTVAAANKKRRATAAAAGADGDGAADARPSGNSSRHHHHHRRRSANPSSASASGAEL